MRVTNLRITRGAPSSTAARRDNSALVRQLIARDWLLDLIGDGWTARLLRSCLGAPADEASFALALAQIDRLPEWYDLLMRFVADPARERVTLIALGSAPRLAGPYAATIVRDEVQRRVRVALRADAPAEALWQISLDALRWARLAPGLSTVALALPDRRSTLLDCAARMRDLVREIPSNGSISRELEASLLAWPASLAGDEEKRAAPYRTQRPTPAGLRQEGLEAA